MSISFWGEDFQRINMHYNGRNSPAYVGFLFIYGASMFYQFWYRVTRWSFMTIYSQICRLISEEKIFKELICIIMGKTAPPPCGSHLLTEQMCFSYFGRGSLDATYANLQSNLSINFWVEDFQSINIHNNRKNSPPLWEPN